MYSASAGQVTVIMRVTSVRLSSRDSNDWISLSDIDERIRVLMTSRNAEIVRRGGHVTRRRRPVQLIPSHDARSTTEPEVVQLINRKQQLFGRLMTWMTAGWHRGSRSAQGYTDDSSVACRQMASPVTVKHAPHFQFIRDNDVTVPSPLSSTSGQSADDVIRTSRHRQSIDKLRRCADCVRVASQEFYSALTGNTMFGDVSRSRDRMLRCSFRNV